MALMTLGLCWRLRDDAMYGEEISILLMWQFFTSTFPFAEGHKAGDFRFSDRFVLDELVDVQQIIWLNESEVLTKVVDGLFEFCEDSSALWTGTFVLQRV